MLIIQRAALMAIFCSNILACGDITETAQPIVIDYTNSRDKRIDRIDGKLKNPILIALAVASTSQKKAIETLAERELFYNFLVDLQHRTIGYFTPNPTQNIHEACASLRPRALGVSTYTAGGYLQIRDVNTASIAVGLVGNESDFKNPESRAFFTTAIQEMCRRHNISNVVSYPMLAVHSDGSYGRVETERHVQIDFKQLAQNGLGVWPQEKDLKIKSPFDFTTDAGRKAAIVWSAGALNKAGMMAAITANNNHPQLRSAVMTFQKHYQLPQQNGIVCRDTLVALNSILKQMQRINPELEEIEPQPLETFYPASATALATCAAAHPSLADIDVP